MRFFLIAPIALTIAGYAQDSARPQPEAASPDRTQPPGSSGTTLVRRLESVTWNPVTAELSWVVSTWDPAGPSGQPATKDTYSMSIDAAQMKFKGEGRGFDPEEARHVRMIMDMISMYAVESTVWWDSGKGDKIEGPAEGARPSPEATKPAPDAAKPIPQTIKPGQSAPAKPGPKTAPVVLRGPVAATRLVQPEDGTPAGSR
jgi:hypothetical protein